MFVLHSLTTYYVAFNLFILVLAGIFGVYLALLRQKQNSCNNNTNSNAKQSQSTQSPSLQSPQSPSGSSSTVIFSLQQVQTQHSNKFLKEFCSYWFESMRALKSVYGSVIVHCFDVATDIDVILEWYKNDDTLEFALISVGIIIFYRIVSAVLLFYDEKNSRRCLLELFDLLLFEEVYFSHKQFVHSLKTGKIKKSLVLY